MPQAEFISAEEVQKRGPPEGGSPLGSKPGYEAQREELLKRL
ncbi:hypothetical protein [uncultured Intestinimonas sp.]|nr:hypothetical protein [uncultured Intestinimonas sp.]